MHRLTAKTGVGKIGETRVDKNIKSRLKLKGRRKRVDKYIRDKAETGIPSGRKLEEHDGQTAAAGRQAPKGKHRAGVSCNSLTRATQEGGRWHGKSNTERAQAQ